MVKRIFSVLTLVWLGSACNAFALSDPTRPTDPSLYFGNNDNGSEGEWSLQSILYASDRRVAVINGTRVREGDRIGSARVVHIQDSQVVLNAGGRKLTLHLLPTTMKVRP